MHMPDNYAFTNRQYVDINKMRVAGAMLLDSGGRGE